MKFMESIVGTGGLAQFTLDQLIGKMTPDKRKFAAEALKKWLANEAKLKPRPDVLSLVEQFGKRIDAMAADMDIQIVDGKPVVKAVGTGQDTLRALERGTNWFDPCDDVVSVVISSLWKS